jgi:DHA1 family bicyclomycin/chloramphenicol resistance-like MFS transporter
MVVALWFYIASLGGIMPIATAQAMASQGRVAGSASATIGVMQFGFGMLSAFTVSLLESRTTLAMALPLAFFGVAGVVLRRIMLR